MRCQSYWKPNFRASTLDSSLSSWVELLIWNLQHWIVVQKWAGHSFSFLYMLENHLFLLPHLFPAIIESFLLPNIINKKENVSGTLETMMSLGKSIWKTWKRITFHCQWHVHVLTYTGTLYNLYSIFSPLALAEFKHHTLLIGFWLTSRFSVWGLCISEMMILK